MWPASEFKGIDPRGRRIKRRIPRIYLTLWLVHTFLSIILTWPFGHPVAFSLAPTGQIHLAFMSGDDELSTCTWAEQCLKDPETCRLNTRLCSFQFVYPSIQHLYVYAAAIRHLHQAFFDHFTMILPSSTPPITSWSKFWVRMLGQKMPQKKSHNRRNDHEDHRDGKTRAVVISRVAREEERAIWEWYVSQNSLVVSSPSF